MTGDLDLDSLLLALAILVGVATLLQIGVIAGGLISRRAALRRYAEGPAKPPKNLSVAVYIPVRGGGKELEESIDRILDQRGLEYDLVVVTETSDEPAARYVRERAETEPRLKHVAAGRTVRCGQKNHNLLAGIAAHPDYDIYVTADIGIQPGPDWLARLVEPFADPETSVTTTHQWVFGANGQSRNFGAMLHSSVHAYLHSAAGFPGMVNAWGGSTAIRARAFHDEGLAAEWAESVVDDVETSAWAMEHGKKILYLPGALVWSEIGPVPLKEFWKWLLRQCQFQFFCNRRVWLVLAATQTMTFLAVVAAAPLLWLAYRDHIAWLPAVVIAVCAVFVLLSATLMRHNEPEEDSGYVRWFIAAIGLTLVGCPALLMAGVKRNIDWAGTRYRLDWRSGAVRRIEDLRPRN